MNNHMLTAMLIAVFCFITCVPSTTTAQIKTVSGHMLTPETMDRFLEAQMDSLDIPGLSIAVINDNEVVYHRTLGVKNLESEAPVDPQTVFEAASMTKPFFAYAVMKLVEEGLLNLDTPLHTYKPHDDLSHDERYKLMTARMVLSHQTGLPNWRTEKKFQELEIQFTPGTGFSYSGEAYGYLGKVIAHLKRKRLYEVFQEYLLDPLCMKQSAFVWNEHLEAHKATGYAFGNNAFPLFKPFVAHPAGTLHTEATDFARFLIALMDEQGLTKSSFDEMFTSHIDIPEDHPIHTEFGQDAWALGWAMEQTPFGIKYSHGGNNFDFQSYGELFRDHKIGYVFFVNNDQGMTLNASLKVLLNEGR